MEQAELFILFPEYTEGDQAPTAPYLLTLDLPSEEEIEEYIGRLRDMAEFLTHENYAGYYDMENVRAFSRPLQMLEDCYPDKYRSLLAAIRQWENWREEAAEGDAALYFYYVYPLASDTLTEILARKKSEEKSGNAYLVVNNGAINHTGEVLPVFDCKENHQEIEQRACRCKNVHDWFVKNRKPPRRYTHNPKHGEHGKENQPGESPLAGWDYEAEELLHRAVGQSVTGPLFYYDEKYKKHIEFKNENTQVNSYHAFHIDTSILCHRIPKEVMEKIELVRK